ncbi:MAG: hypothetical protein WDM84_09230 [Bauldia sp.]
MRRIFGRDARAGLVAGISAAYSNALLVGIPLIVTAYGRQGAAAVSLLIAIHLPILMTVSAILIERALVADGLAADADTRTIVRGIARSIARNPIVLGLFTGILWRLTGLADLRPRRRRRHPHRRHGRDARALCGRHEPPQVRRLRQRAGGAGRRLHQARRHAGGGLPAGCHHHPAAACLGEGDCHCRRLPDRGERLSGGEPLQGRARRSPPMPSR